MRADLRDTNVCHPLTFTTMLPTLAEDLMMGLPTSEGKMWSGKLDPA